MFLGNPMMMRKLASGPNIANLFATTLYTGSGSSQTINTGLNMLANEGVTWIKRRDASGDHHLFDNLRGDNVALKSNTSDANSGGSGLWSAASNGFSLANNATDISGATYASWNFLSFTRFFDVVTWSGNNSNRTISHSLATEPGLIIVKRRDSVGDWLVYHRSLANTDYLALNSTAGTATDAALWNSTSATTSVFSLGTNVDVNGFAGAYVAYLFAHDTASDGVVQCGSYTGNGSVTGPTISLGWQPQWLMIKRTDSTASWVIMDSVRGQLGSDDYYLHANSLGAESYASHTRVDYLSTGFQLRGTNGQTNASGGTYVYLAIRAAA